VGLELVVLVAVEDSVEEDDDVDVLEADCVAVDDDVADDEDDEVVVDVTVDVAVDDDVDVEVGVEVAVDVPVQEALLVDVSLAVLVPVEVPELVPVEVAVEDEEEVRVKMYAFLDHEGVLDGDGVADSEIVRDGDADSELAAAILDAHDQGARPTTQPTLALAAVYPGWHRRHGSSCGKRERSTQPAGSRCEAWRCRCAQEPQAGANTSPPLPPPPYHSLGPIGTHAPHC
jgi:hypothetical protein